jgi:response regulator RpfG family c-di-GMP phosphodiesterase
MEARDPNTPDSYATHLAEVNKTNAVIATEDIYNSNGILLVKKGFAIKPEIALKILNHKLIKPLETLVNVDDAITGQQLYDHTRKLLSRFADCRAIHDVLKLDNLLMAQCQRYAAHNLLVQKMTVLSLQLPKEYEKGLFCAWLALAIAHHMKLQPSELESAFIAGLTHDTGMLHINPEIVSKTGNLTAEEWRAVQSHVLIGDVFLSHIKGMSDATRRAVREHHERCDGSGYPFGLFENQLSSIGQIVAMADSLYAIRRKGNGAGESSFGEIVPILQLNSTVHTYAVYAAAIQIFRLAQLQGPKPVAKDHVSQFAAQLIQQRKNLDSRFTAIKPLTNHFSLDHPQRRVRTARLMLDRLWIIVAGSGLFNEALGRWFEYVQATQVAAATTELTEVAMMYQEIEWQMKQLGRVLELIAGEANKLPEPSRQLIRNVTNQLSAHNRPGEPSP